MAWEDMTAAERDQALWAVLERCYREAEAIIAETQPNSLAERLGALHEPVTELGMLEHAAPGVALTLAAYKVCNPAQDVTAHQEGHFGGFSARGYDTRVTVPFLIQHSLPRNVESHWLSQTFSYAPEYRPGVVVKTTPKRAGPLMVDVVYTVQQTGAVELASAVVTGILVEKIRIRNRGRMVLTRPKELSVEATASLIARHLATPHRRNGPRLPQLAMYAVYKCLIRHSARYQGCQLEPLGRMKSADRKADTVGDVVVTQNGAPVEAVETKHNLSITFMNICEAIEKVRALAVRRYYLLSTRPIVEEDRSRIEEKKASFLKQNGCEIIINGVIESIGYYLRILPSTTEFIFEYVDLLEKDDDTSYEHRLSWNNACELI